MGRAADRARRHSAASVLRRIDDDTWDPLTEAVSRERYALKPLRGDFDGMPGAAARPAREVRAALEAVDA